MEHLGDITKISGYTVPTVDCIIGGSPCQDLSVAGKRAGLDGERSGLFMEQIRIVKEMREQDERNGRTDVDIRCRYLVWENVPGALSSGKPRGEDFRIVLEELAKVKDKNAVIPMPPNGKWTNSGCIMGDGWSVAWRVLDAQFWGVPQRRRRIALVADFGGQSAPEILFVRESVSGHSEQGEPKREEASSDASRGFGADDRTGVCVDGTGGERDLNIVSSAGFCTQQSAKTRGVGFEEECSPTLCSGAIHCVCYGISSYNSNAMKSRNPHSGIYEADTSRTLDINCGNPACNQGGIMVVDSVPYTLKIRSGCEGGGKGALVQEDKSATLATNNDQYLFQPIEQTPFCRSSRPKFKGDATTWKEADVANTLNTFDQGEVRANELVVAVDCRNATEDVVSGALQSAASHSLNGNNVVRTRYIVRRLTPLECERLQGYPDGWTDIGEYIDTNGKKRQTSDAARYKALGNSIALPPWKWVLKRLCGCYERDATMASLFDGIGGFPYLWEQINGKGTCLWASEIEEFPIAVTKARIL